MWFRKTNVCNEFIYTGFQPQIFHPQFQLLSHQECEDLKTPKEKTLKEAHLSQTCIHTHTIARMHSNLQIQTSTKVEDKYRHTLTNTLR